MRALMFYINFYFVSIETSFPIRVSDSVTLNTRNTMLAHSVVLQVCLVFHALHYLLPVYDPVFLLYTLFTGLVEINP